jgi:hypothetical protein
VLMLVSVSRVAAVMGPILEFEVLVSAKVLAVEYHNFQMLATLPQSLQDEGSMRYHVLDIHCAQCRCASSQAPILAMPWTPHLCQQSEPCRPGCQASSQ